MTRTHGIGNFRNVLKFWKKCITEIFQWLNECNHHYANNRCLGWHLQTFKHCNSEEALIFKDFRNFYSIYFFVTFNWELFPVDWENNILHLYFQLGIWPNICYKISKKMPERLRKKNWYVQKILLTT
jgi:hypothetical protein